MDIKTVGRTAATGSRELERLAESCARVLAHVQPLGESLQLMGGRLAEVGTAAAGVLAAVAEALLPAFDAVCDAALRVLNTLALLTARLFGQSSGMAKATGSAKGYSKALGGVGSAAKKAAGELAGFDRLDVLGASAAGSGGGSGAVLGGLEELGGIEISGSLLAALDALLKKAQELWAFLVDKFGPGAAAWRDAFVALAGPVTETVARVKEALTHLWEGGLKPLAAYILGDFIPAIVNGFSETFAPIFNDVLGALVLELGRDFEFMAGLAVRAIHDLLLPALELLKGVVLDLFAGISTAWDTYGGLILDGWHRLKEGIREVVDKLYTGVLLPLFQNLMAVLAELWDNHLAPLWEKLMLFFGALVEAALSLWNNALQPLIAWIVDTFGPMFVEITSWVWRVFGQVAGGIMDLAGGMLDALRGLLTFLSGVFAGDWNKAWQGMGDFAKGVWEGLGGFIRGVVNGIIACVNGLIGGVVAGINTVVNAINTLSFTVPDWVPGIGGSTVGFALSHITAPQIPLLAKGAVIPPNREFLAVLGDQNSGRNLEAPEGLIREILRDELGELVAGLGGGDINIRFTGSLSQLARVLKPEIERETARTGASLLT